MDHLAMWLDLFIHSQTQLVVGPLVDLFVRPLPDDDEWIVSRRSSPSIFWVGTITRPRRRQRGTIFGVDHLAESLHTADRYGTVSSQDDVLVCQLEEVSVNGIPVTFHGTNLICDHSCRSVSYQHNVHYATAAFPKWIQLIANDISLMSFYKRFLADFVTLFCSSDLACESGQNNKSSDCSHGGVAAGLFFWQSKARTK